MLDSICNSIEGGSMNSREDSSSVFNSNVIQESQRINLKQKNQDSSSTTY